MNVRPAAVAGMFYPADPATLKREVATLLAGVPEVADGARVVIAPHAGYQYSGATAAHAYRQLESHGQHIRRVVLLGPAHRVYVKGMAIPSVDAFATPLGDIQLDAEGLALVADLPGVQVSDEAHAAEHSLEVHLPFLQTVLGHFTLIPIVVGVCTARHVEAVLDALWGDETTAIVVSSDLSHFHPYHEAQEIDASTTARIEARATTLHGEEACGAYALNGLMLAAKERGLQVRTLATCNSGDTAGDKYQVVGYGAYALA